jgi:hypothetical protein
MDVLPEEVRDGNIPAMIARGKTRFRGAAGDGDDLLTMGTIRPHTNTIRSSGCGMKSGRMARRVP